MEDRHQDSGNETRKRSRPPSVRRLVVLGRQERKERTADLDRGMEIVLIHQILPPWNMEREVGLGIGIGMDCCQHRRQDGEDGFGMARDVVEGPGMTRDWNEGLVSPLIWMKDRILKKRGMTDLQLNRDLSAGSLIGIGLDVRSAAASDLEHGIGISIWDGRVLDQQRGRIWDQDWQRGQNSSLQNLGFGPRIWNWDPDLDVFHPGNGIGMTDHPDLGCG